MNPSQFMSLDNYRLRVKSRMRLYVAIFEIFELWWSGARLARCVTPIGARAGIFTVAGPWELAPLLQNWCCDQLVPRVPGEVAARDPSGNQPELQWVRDYWTPRIRAIETFKTRAAMRIAPLMDSLR